MLSHLFAKSVIADIICGGSAVYLILFMYSLGQCSFKMNGRFSFSFFSFSVLSADFMKTSCILKKKSHSKKDLSSIFSVDNLSGNITSLDFKPFTFCSLME